jgi:hypothetical protein
MNIDFDDIVNEVFEGYCTTALWSNGFDDYEVDDIDYETQDKMFQNVCDFVEKAGDLLNELDLSKIGHDFWLTSNNHSSGFWDDDYENELGKRLTELSHGYSMDLYIGDDNKIYN